MRCHFLLANLGIVRLNKYYRKIGLEYRRYAGHLPVCSQPPFLPVGALPCVVGSWYSTDDFFSFYYQQDSSLVLPMGGPGKRLTNGRRKWLTHFLFWASGPLSTTAKSYELQHLLATPVALVQNSTLVPAPASTSSDIWASAKQSFPWLSHHL